jgi:Na+-driven multidrug efflux pump
MSSGGIGAGIAATVARSIGLKKKTHLSEIVSSGAVISLFFGILIAIVFLAFGKHLFYLMGARDSVLDAAVRYSNIAFCGAIFIWTFNGLASVLRGIGSVAPPARFALFGAPIVMLVTPTLIVGGSVFGGIGLIGGIVALISYYAIGSIYLGWEVWKLGIRMNWQVIGFGSGSYFRAILSIGIPSSAITGILNINTIMLTGIVGANFAPQVLAGYGAGSRLDLALLPILFGIGSAATTLAGANIGASQFKRAIHATWISAMLAFITTGVIGVLAAIFPWFWIGLFSSDVNVLEAGSLYLTVVGPAYGFLGIGTVLFFASQGLGKLKWSWRGTLLRLAVASGGALIAVTAAQPFWIVALAIAISYVVMAAVLSKPFWSSSDPQTT